MKLCPNRAGKLLSDKITTRKRIVTTLYASVSSKGHLLEQSEHASPPPAEVIIDFMNQAKAAGNMIMGRTTAQLLLANSEVRKDFPSVHLVILSNQLESTTDYAVTQSPEAALTYLSNKGYSNAFVTGGAKVYHSFLSKNLVDHLIININAEITTEGKELITQEKLSANYVTSSMKDLAQNITQLKLRKNNKPIL